MIGSNSACLGAAGAKGNDLAARVPCLRRRARYPRRRSRADAQKDGARRVAVTRRPKDACVGCRSLQKTLHAHGWVEDDNLVIEYRYAGDDYE